MDAARPNQFAGELRRRRNQQRRTANAGGGARIFGFSGGKRRDPSVWRQMGTLEWKERAGGVGGASVSRRIDQRQREKSVRQRDVLESLCRTKIGNAPNRGRGGAVRFRGWRPGGRDRDQPAKAGRRKFDRFVFLEAMLAGPSGAF